MVVYTCASDESMVSQRMSNGSSGLSLKVIAHAESMVLSHDTNCFFHWTPRDFVAADLPRWHDRHIHDDVIPALRQRGVTDEQIHTMLVENPRKCFEKQGAY